MAPNTPRLAAGLLTVLGLFGVATPAVAAPPQDPAESSGPAAVASAAPSGPPTVLLLTNGKVLQGEIRKDESGYFLKRSFGTVLHPRRAVEGVFRSMHDVYEYKKARRPENDPDERMKLASWCLEQKMRPEAKAELSALLAMEPENQRVRAMMANIDRADASREIDSEVVRTSGEMESPPPAELSLMKLREEFARNPRAAGMPAVFDLDTPLAVRRYQEFSQTVHPILQRRCAKCHNEETPGDFQMIRTQAQRDLSNDLIRRANLEATLAIVDRDDLARSPLLTAAGMTHGAGGRPVLGGPASPEYRLLAAWVTSLKAPAPAVPDAPGAPRPASAPTERFAAGRVQPKADPAMPPAPGPASAPAPAPATGRIPGLISPEALGQLPQSRLDDEGREVPIAPAPAGSFLPGSGTGLPGSVPPPSAFLPPDPTAPKVAPVATPAAPAVEALPSPEEARPGQKVRMADGKVGMKLPDGKVVPYVTLEAPPTDGSAPAKPKRKFDPKTLESFLKGTPKP